MIVLHPKYIDEIKNHPDLSFDDAIKKASPESTGNLESINVLIDFIDLFLQPHCWLRAVPQWNRHESHH